MTQIKICGLKTLEDVAIVNEYNPDYIGFIFVKGRKRYIEPILAAKLKNELNSNIRAVGVFVDESPEIVAGLAESGIIDIIQLHGKETNDYIEELRLLTNKPVIKAIRVERKEDVEKAKESLANIVLFDCGAGGTGKAFDWNLIKDFDKTFFLAGGVSSDNVLEAMSLKPFGLDVSSGVETDGKKDKDKIDRFINLVRKEDKKND